MLNVTKEFLCYNSFFINCYVAVDYGEGPAGFGDYLYLAYRYVPHCAEYLTLEKRLKSHPKFLKVDGLPDYIDIWVFDISSEYLADTGKFIMGAYSQLSEKLKRNILEFFNQSKDNKIGQILYKSSKLRKQMEIKFGAEINPQLDLYDVPDRRIETFSYYW
jgi:hypothetical protein